LLLNAAVDALEDIQTIRRKNLDVLVAEAQSVRAIAGAMLARFPGETGHAPDYANVLSQYRGKKPMGDKFARKLEEAMGKARGWMDRLHEVDQVMEVKEAGQIAMSMDPEKRANWLNIGRALIDQGAKPSGATPFPGVPKGGKKRRPGSS
jgi:hypothetical protein